MTAGRISDFNPLMVRKPVLHQPSCTVSPRPKDGSQLSQTEKAKISKIPVTKVGTDMPISEMTLSRLLITPFGCSAV